MTDPAAPLTVEDICKMDAAEAGRVLADMAARYKEQNPDGRLTADQDTAELGKLREAPLKPTAHDPIEAALANDPSQFGQFTTVSSDEMSPYRLQVFVDALRDTGIPPDGIRRIVKGEEFEPGDVEMARQWKARAMNDPELRRLILSGDPEARHVLVGMSAIIAAGAK